MATKKTKNGAKAAKGFWAVGQTYFIRSVTTYSTGRLVSIDEHEIVLADAAWVADTGRFSQALKTGDLSEVEPYPDGLVAIGRGGLVDACLWQHPLPRSVQPS